MLVTNTVWRLYFYYDKSSILELFAPSGDYYFMYIILFYFWNQ